MEGSFLFSDESTLTELLNMKKINILSTVNKNIVFKQYSSSVFSEKFQFYYNSKEKVCWDLIVVYEEIDQTYEFFCKKNCLLFISGEPPICKNYPESFLKQFSLVISAHSQLTHPNNLLTQQSLLWYFGYDFDNHSINYDLDQLIDLKVKKTKDISFITSSRSFLPGHMARLKVLKEIQKRYGNRIEIYGSGLSFVSDKAEAILPYRFSLCIENTMTPHYWSEKFADAILGYAVPIYWGCPNIKEYFPSVPYIWLEINDKKNIFATIDHILSAGETLYQEKLPALIEARNRLLYRYNIFSSIIEYDNLFFFKRRKRAKNNFISFFSFQKIMEG